jgi:nickel transport protein
MKKIIVLYLLIFLCIIPQSFAHRVNFETRQHAPAVTVKAFFSASAPLAGAIVEIYAPGDDRPFQTGRTDTKGNFAFIPNATGSWRVVIDDERGHTGNVVVSITGDFFETAEEAAAPSDPLQEPAVPAEIEIDTAAAGGIPAVYRVIFGLLLIVSITAVAYALRLRQELSSRSQRS